MSIEIVFILLFSLMVFSALSSAYCMGWLRCDRDLVKPILDGWERSNELARRILKSTEPPNGWCPDECPVTGLPFFMWIEHPDQGWVPTYGGPYDSYTIPTREPKFNEHGYCELSRERFDHDRGGWVESETLALVLTTEERLIELEERVEGAKGGA